MRYCNSKKEVFIFVLFLVMFWFRVKECYAAKSVENNKMSYCNEA